MKIKSFLWILLFGVFCSNSMAELPKVIAHRGYWKTPSSAQNSLRALELADSIGVYGSEFDVWLTKDDVLIVNHDAVINGMDIESSSSKMLLKQKLKNGETVPTLDAFLNRAKKLSVRLICELKPHKDKQREAEAVKRIVEMVRKKRSRKTGRIYYIFGRGFVGTYRASPQRYTGVLFERFSATERFKVYRCGGTGLSYQCV